MRHTRSFVGRCRERFVVFAAHEDRLRGQCSGSMRIDNLGVFAQEEHARSARLGPFGDPLSGLGRLSEAREGTDERPRGHRVNGRPPSLGRRQSRVARRVMRTRNERNRGDSGEFERQGRGQWRWRFREVGWHNRPGGEQMRHTWIIAAIGLGALWVLAGCASGASSGVISSPSPTPRLTVAQWAAAYVAATSDSARRIAVAASAAQRLFKLMPPPKDDESGRLLVPLTAAQARRLVRQQQEASDLIGRYAADLPLGTTGTGSLVKGITSRELANDESNAALAAADLQGAVADFAPTVPLSVDDVQSARTGFRSAEGAWNRAVRAIWAVAGRENPPVIF